jgi:hypothetical protein
MLDLRFPSSYLLCEKICGGLGPREAY